MKQLFAFFLAVGVFASVAHADISDTLDNSTSSYVRPGPRPAPYPGNPGRPEPYPGPRPGPRPHPGPGYPPPPPPPPGPGYHYEYVSCSAYGYRYTECYLNPYGLQQIRFYRQDSYEACIWGQTVGAYNDRVWVDRGCAATFEVIRYY